MDNLEVGKIIQEVIDRKNLHKNSVAECAGLSRTTLDSYITGKTKPKMRNLKKLAKCLEIDLTTFTGQIGQFESLNTATAFNNEYSLNQNNEKTMSIELIFEMYRDFRRSHDRLQENYNDERNRVNRLITLLENKYGGDPNGQKKAV